MPADEIVIDPDFEGPPGSANGGYLCGLLAQRLGGEAEVTLRKRIPLGVPLRVDASGEGLVLHDGQAVVAEARATSLTCRPPEPPTFEEALAASASFPGFAAHPFPRCVVCGPEHPDASALRVFPGPIAGRSLLAAVWDLPRVDRSELAWAAMDCPAGWAAGWFGQVAGPAVLGRMAAWLDRAVRATDALVVTGWLEGVDGRKLHAGSALYTRAGALVGCSRQTWIALAGTGARP